MTLLFLSFIAGVLTVLAPCILPLLPIIIGGSVQQEGHRFKPFIITASLAVSIVVFTLLLKVSTALIDVQEHLWSTISGVIIIIFGVISLFPTLWEKFSVRLNLTGRSNKLLSASAQKKTYWGEILMGASLGPVFSSCSPTYFVILATILPQSFAKGILYLIVYALGLALILLLIALVGQRFVKRIQWAADPNGWFKRGLGILFILVGIFVITGADKKVQTYILDKGYFNVTMIEDALLEKFSMPTSLNTSDTDPVAKSLRYPRYQEIQNPTAFLNSEPFQLKDVIGKKVVVLDFMTYSCINCIRTVPYLNAWYEKYKDQGLEIVGIHAPEFSFERKKENVEAALASQGIKFPVVMDNDFATWRAYKNQYWPAKYIIDIDGYIVYNHNGEGAYEEIEHKIQQLLEERKMKLGNGTKTISKDKTVVSGIETPEARSPEIYFGADRNEYLGNGTSFKEGVQQFRLPSDVVRNTLYLEGNWNITPEFAESNGQTKIVFRYSAKSVYFVASADKNTRVKILRNGKPLQEEAGSDVLKQGRESFVNIKEDKLYSLIQDKEVGEHVLEIIIENSGLKAFTFTFG